jgi:hypothetical protein
LFPDHFDGLISKIMFKKLKKYYFVRFMSEKHFEKQLQPQSQTLELVWKCSSNRVPSKFKFFLIKINFFFIFLDYFDGLLSKIIFLK